MTEMEETKLQKNQMKLINKLTNRRLAEPEELLSLIASTKGLTRRALQFLSGNNSRRIYQSLADTDNLKSEKASGYSANTKMTIYFEKNYSTAKVLHFDKLAAAVWFIREKGYKLGRVKVLQDDNLTINCLLTSSQYLNLQVIDINSQNYTQPLTLLPQTTPVLVFDDESLQQAYLSQSGEIANQIAQMIQAGAVLISQTNIVKTTIISGFVLQNHLVTDDQGRESKRPQVVDLIAPLGDYNFKFKLQDRRGNMSKSVKASYDWVLEHSHNPFIKQEGKDDEN